MLLNFIDCASGDTISSYDNPPFVPNKGDDLYVDDKFYVIQDRYFHYREGVLAAIQIWVHIIKH
jgi:hypothetical protein